MTSQLSSRVTLEFYRHNLKFSAGHFTIFSSTSRERLHGHNYYLEAAISADMGEPGITFNYKIFRQRLVNLCQQLHLFFLLPKHSPYLQITEQEQHYHIVFNHDSFLFPKGDVLLLPVANITLEELSRWFIEQLAADEQFIASYHIHSISIKCFNGHAHSATAEWTAVS